MSEKERGDIMDALKELPEADKQFMLGYAAGRSAAKPEDSEDSSKQTVDQK
jgi:hypothetical protein